MELTADLIETAESEYRGKRAEERVAADSPFTPAEVELFNRAKFGLKGK